MGMLIPKSKTGITTWSYVWTPSTCADGQTILVQYESFASLAQRQLAAVKLVVTSDRGLEDVRVVDMLDGQSALRTNTVKTRADRASHRILSAVSPVGVDDVAAYVLASTHGDGLIPEEDTDEYISDYVFQFAFDNSVVGSCSANPFQPEPALASIIQRYRLQPGLQSATVYKYAGVASSEHFGSNAETFVSAVVSSAVDRGYDVLRKEHSAQVGKLMHPDFVADFRDPVTGSLPPGDDILKALQITAISSAYYLYTSLLPYDPARDEDPGTCVACNSLSVGGLVAQTYGGKIFWDADLFVAPAIQGIHPRLARQFSLYRINRAAQARKNTERHGLKTGSMLYAWTSGRYGQCYNISAPCVLYQYHLNADIALSMTMGRNTSGDKDWFDQYGAADVVDGVATGLSDILRRRPTGVWGIDVMTDADEYYMFVADGSFTATAVSTALEFASELRRERGIHVESDWLEKMEHMAIPTSEDGVVLEFAGMENDVFPKQADLVLSFFPYDYRRNFSLEKHRLVMDYYSVRTDPHGPAMTWSLYAIAANSLATSGCAFWSYLVKSFQPYVRGPWYQFSEQQDDNPGVLDPLTGNAINTAFPFLTGHGGLLQVLTNGFLGLRVTQRHLVIDPSLPPQLAHFKPPVQFYNGAVVSFRMNRTHTSITRLDAALFDGLVSDQYGPDADMPVTIGRGVDDADAQTVFLPVHGTAVVENRVYDTKATVPGNILQCQHTTSTAAADSGTARGGDLPFAATDGYGGTFWQPATSNGTAALVVDIRAPSPPPRPLEAIYLDFAIRPPKDLKVWVSNSSDFAPATLLAAAAIHVTAPWDPASPVVRYAGNVTTIRLDGTVWSGRFAKLEVAGCWEEGDGAGATVAEFALVAGG